MQRQRSTRGFSKLAESAIHFAELGYQVFPLASRSKLPMKNSHGLLDATSDADQVAAWWDAEPSANIGIRTDGLVVIDPDLIDKESANPKPNPWLTEARARSLAIAPTQQTWSGGRQYIFRQPNGRHYRNTDSALADHVDTRGDGGYIVAAPSFVRMGRRSGYYQWAEGCELEIEPHALPEPPDWLIELLDAIEANRGKSTNGKAYITPADKLIPKGKRDSTLASIAGTMRRRGMHLNEIEAALTEVAKRCEDGDDIDPAKIAASIARYGSASPLINVENRTDDENGRRFAREHGAMFRHVATWGKDIVWTSQRWQLDNILAMQGLAKRTNDGIWAEVLAELPKPTTDRQLVTALTSWGKYSASAHGTDNMLAKARSEPGIVITHHDLDRDEWLLNVANGTIDLRSGKLRPHDKSDLITKLCPIIFDPEAEAPRWRRFVGEIMAGDDEMVKFLRRLAGYWLTGSVREHALPIFYGLGANGKSVFLNTVLALLGPDYAVTAPPDLLLVKRHSNHPTELADLFGKRLVCSIEIEGGRHLAESLVKSLTGGENVRARRMREDFWEFSPTHKVVIAANHRPGVRGQDHGIWRRLALVPFNLRFWDADKGEFGPPELRQDKKLQEELLGELPGILNWALLGCAEWQAEGLAMPPSVLAASDAYRRESDSIAAFLAECCIVTPTASVGASVLFAAYCKWCEDNREWAAKRTEFAHYLNAKGFQEDRFTSGPNKGKAMRRGIGMRASEASEATSD
jgi:putative DNA primase/helicase